jgi:hypothetical protein
MIEEQIAIIECYIHVRKGKEVRIKYPSTMREIMLVQKAYAHAQRWFEMNDTQMIQL